MRTPEWYAMRMAKILRQQEPKIALRSPAILPEKPPKAKRFKVNLKPSVRAKSITLPEPPTSKEIVSFANSENIMFIKGWGNYSLVYESGKNSKLACSTLKSFHRLLPALIRVHKGFLVNPSYIKAVNTEKGDNHIEMINNTIVPVSRRRISHIKSIVTH